MSKDSEKTRRYENKMRINGYVRIHPFVHKEDLLRISKYLGRLRKAREKNLK